MINAAITLPKTAKISTTDLQSNDRASIKVVDLGKNIRIDIQAKDAIVFRAVMNTLTGLLATKEKIENE